MSFELNINIEMKLGLEEMYSGVVKKIKYIRYHNCLQCTPWSTCEKCSGTRKVGEEVIEELNIPPGIEEGMVMKFIGKGHWKKDVRSKLLQILDGKLNQDITEGNLYVTIKAKPHPLYTREGDDLRYICRIKKSELEIGDKIIELLHLNDERIKIRIPQHISDGQFLRIPGKGFKNVAGNSTGNFLIKVCLVS